MSGLKELLKKGLGLGDMAFNAGGGAITWFPGHMAAATRAIRNRLKLSDLVIEVRDARIPLSSANADLQPHLSGKRRLVALNKKDLANPNIMHKWTHYFESCKHDCVAINAHSKSSVKKLLDVVEFKLKEVICREPTLLVMVVGVPNVGKSALINSIHQIAKSRFPVQEKNKRAAVGPLPGVTQDIAGFKLLERMIVFQNKLKQTYIEFKFTSLIKMVMDALNLGICHVPVVSIAHKPSIYVLDTPGVLVPRISDIETGLKLALAGSVKDAVVGEERIAQYLLAVLDTRGTPLHWRHLNNRRIDGIEYEAEENHEYSLKNLKPKRRNPPNRSDLVYVEDLVMSVQHALYSTLTEFNGSVEDESDLENLIDLQFSALQKAMKIPHKASEARLMVSKKLLTLFRSGKLGPFILDDVPNVKPVS